jgi:diacylglycerol kinase (ATP)
MSSARESTPSGADIPSTTGAMAPVVDGRALKGKRGLQRVFNALHYSLDGLAAAWKGEDAFRQEVLLAALMAPLAFLIGFTVLERLMLLGSLVLVLIVEILNTAIESVVDRHSFEINPLAKRAKDLGSAAVLLALLMTAAVWIALFVDHFHLSFHLNRWS